MMSKVVKYLVSHGADCNRLDASSNTPLHLAVISGNRAIVSILLPLQTELGVDSAGKTPLQWAQSRLHRLRTNPESVNSLSGLQSELLAIIDSLADHIRSKGSAAGVEKLEALKGKVKDLYTREEMEEIQHLLQTLTL